MSADDFQTKYASVLEGMLKSAVAETTKLFETMVDELKAEISRIKKENEDLKTRCSQFENAKIQATADTSNSDSLRGTNGFEKRDTAVQCDLVPFRTMLVEQCQPLREPSLPNLARQWGYEERDYGFQEHNNVTQRLGDSEMAHVQVKQEDDGDNSFLQTVLKQENDESTLACCQVVIDKAALPRNSTCEIENKDSHINQQCSTGQITFPRKNADTPNTQDPACSETDSGLQGIRNQLPELAHSLVISLAAVKEDLEEECEIGVNTAKSGTQTNRLTSDKHYLLLSQHQSVEDQQPREGVISQSEESDVNQQESGNGHCTVEQLAEPTRQNKDVANELNAGIEKDKASFQPVQRKRGRPPKSAHNLQQLVKKGPQSSSSGVINKGGMVTTLLRENDVEVSSANTVNTATSGFGTSPPLQSKKDDLNIALKDSGNMKKTSAPILILPVKRPSEKNPSNEDSSAAPILNASPGSSHQLRKRCTSATYQDAMLLVEAMNQSTVEDAHSPTNRTAALPQTQCTPFLSTLKPVVEMQAKPQESLLPVVAQEVAGKAPVPEISTPMQSKVETHYVASQIGDAAPDKEDQTHPTNQQHVVTPSSSTAESAPFSSGANQTSVRSSHSKQSNLATQKIIVVPRPASILKPRKIATLSPSQLPAVLSTVVTAQNTSLLPASTAASCGSSVVQKTIYVTSRDLLPVVPLPSSSTSREPQSGTLAQPKITIIIPRPSQKVLLARHLDSAKSHSPDIAATSQFSSKPQDLRVSLDAQIAPDEVTRSFSVKRDETSENLESHKQTTCVSKSTNAPKDTCNPVGQSVEQVPGSVFPVVKPLVEPKLSAVVRLTRLPLQVSNKESFFVSRLLSNGSSRTQSILIHSSTPNKPSSVIIINQPPAKPVCSTNKYPSLKESTVAVSADIPPMSEEPSSVEKKALPFSKTSSILEESQETLYEQPATSYSVSVASRGEEIISNAVQSKTAKESTATVHLTVSKPKDTSDPHVQMTKAQFLEKLAVSPIVEDLEKASTEVADATSCGMESLQTNSIVARRRSKLKSHLHARRAESEQHSEIEAAEVSPKKRRLETDDPNDKKTNKRVPGTVGNNNDARAITPSRSELCKGDVRTRRSVIEPNIVSSERLNDCSESTLVNSGKQIVTSKNNQTRSISPRRSSSAKNYASPKNTKSNCVSPKRTGTTRNGTSPKNIKPICVSPKKTKSGRNATGSSGSHEDKTGRGGSSPQKISLSVSPKKERRSTLTKVSTKQSKRESRSFSPARGIGTADGTVSKKAKREQASSRVMLDKGSDGHKRTGESAPAKKTRSDDRDSEKNLKVVNAKKLAKAAKAKKMATIRMSKQLQKLRDGDKTSPLAENQSNCGTVKKCTTKAIWVPPRMPVTKTQKKETRSQEHSSVYTPSVSLHAIPVRAPPIVSPLQPLSVIGGRLLKNQCGECGRVLSSSAALESHVGLHIGRRPFSCTLCGKSFPDTKGLKRHGRVHRNGRIHVCHQCGKGFVYRFGLTKHLQMVHGRLKPFVCQICNKGFYAKRDVEAHIRIHTGEKPFQCNLCDKKFTRRVELNVHLRWHNGEKRHWCPYCGKGFLDFNNLKRHKYIHTGEKPHSCPHCPKHFTQSGHLKKHVKNVHKIQ